MTMESMQAQRPSQKVSSRHLLPGPIAPHVMRVVRDRHAHNVIPARERSAAGTLRKRLRC
jgi:hypothetical protein